MWVFILAKFFYFLFRYVELWTVLQKPIFQWGLQYISYTVNARSMILSIVEGLFNLLAVTYHLLKFMTIIYLSQYFTLIHVQAVQTSFTGMWSQQNGFDRVTKTNNWNRLFISVTITIMKIDLAIRCVGVYTLTHFVAVIDPIRDFTDCVFFPIVTFWLIADS